MTPPEPSPAESGNEPGNNPVWTLRRARPSDAPDFAEMMAEHGVFAPLLQLPYPDVDAWRQRLTDQAQPGKADLHLVAELDGRVVASGALFSVAPHVRRRHVLGLGMQVSRAWQGRGVGTALMQALCAYADDWTGALRLELTVYVDNAAAIALYRKFGFVEEGRHRGFALRDGEYVDALAMARLHPRPPAWPGAR